jgi:hypothetical protein
MAKLIKNKSVSFNVLDPYQKKLFEHSGQYMNFSSYVKSLIQRDMEEGEVKIKYDEVEQDNIPVEEDLMNDLI